MSGAARLYHKPSKSEIQDSVADHFRKHVNLTYGLNLKDAHDLYAFSIEHQNDFYRAAAAFTHLIIEYDAVKPLFDTSKTYKDTRHLVNGTLNWAENMLMAHAFRRSQSKKAIIACQESELVVTLTYEELYQHVRLAAHALTSLGVKEGDRVALYMPNNAEAAIMLLAITSIGAICTSASSEFGSTAVLERFSQLDPVLLVTADKYRYGGKDIDILPKVDEIVKVLAERGLKNVVVVGQLNQSRRPSRLPTSRHNCRHLTWQEFLQNGSSAPPTIQFNRGPATRPLWILFSSGTTGKPKALVHSSGGMLLASAAAHSTSSDVRPTDVHLQFTTLSWMMINHQMMHFVHGCSLVLFDGSPLGKLSSLWDIVDAHKVTTMGISPRYLQVLLQAGYFPRERHSLASLRGVGVTGAPMSAELYDFVRDKIKPDVFLNNGSGGTDVCGAFLGPNRTLPMYYCDLQMPTFGCKMEVWSEAGERLADGQEGLLVCANMIPNMPLYFWDDPDDERYHSTYFTTFPNKIAWNQSDWVVHNKKSGFTMLGRADGVLNPSGVRFGSAELYNALEKTTGIADMLAVGQKIGSEERVVLFVKTVDDKPLDDDLIGRIKQTVKSALSSRHIPAVVLRAPDLPYTNNLKRCEIAVKKIVNGTPVDKISTSGMMNPESLAWFANRPELVVKRASKI